MDDPVKNNLSRAIAVMTAWYSDPEGDDRVFTEATANDMMDDGDGPLDLIAGMISLCGWLLTRIEATTGSTAQSTLQDIAWRLNQD